MKIKKELRSLESLAAHVGTTEAREAVLARIEDLIHRCLNNVRTYENKHGETHLIAQPDHGCVAKALGLAAAVLDVIGTRKDQPAQNQLLTDEDFNKQLREAGYELRKVSNGKGAN